MIKTKSTYLLLLLAMILFVADIMMAGSQSITLNDIFQGNYILYSIRLPKAITAVLCGISLPLAGYLLQVLFRNPLAGPYVLGITSGSSFFVGLSIMFVGFFGVTGESVFSKVSVLFSSLIGSALCTFLILMVSRKVSSNVFILVIGLMIGQIFGALESFLQYFSTDKNLKEFIVWSFGSLGNTTMGDNLLFGTISLLMFIISFVLVKPMQVMLLGETYTYAMGFDFKKYRFIFILVASVLTAIATAFCGPIAFVGLSVPIMTRLLFKTIDQRILLLNAAFLGSSFMLCGDILSHSLFSGEIIPINLITTLIGSPFIIYLLIKRKVW